MKVPIKMYYSQHIYNKIYNLLWNNIIRVVQQIVLKMGVIKTI